MVCFAVAGSGESLNPSSPWVRLTPDSSAFDWVAYNPRRRTLFVQFREGNMYRYRDVPEETARELFASQSVGKCFHRKIKGYFVGELVRLPRPTP